jgi:hypothetical protein
LAVEEEMLFHSLAWEALPFREKDEETPHSCWQELAYL